MKHKAHVDAVLYFRDKYLHDFGAAEENPLFIECHKQVSQWEAQGLQPGRCR